MDYKTPGVYVDEKSVLGTSTVGLPTAIPALIGYTETIPEGYDKANPRPIEVNNLLEYKKLFGAAPAEPLRVAMNDNSPGSVQVALQDQLLQTMYYNMQLFYNNGGGKCYVVSLGEYEPTSGSNPAPDPDKTPQNITTYNTAIDTLQKKTDITLIVLTDAAYYLNVSDYGQVCQHALEQCKEITGRFTILDTLYSGDETGFRGAIGDNNLEYGAAYTPFLNTMISPVIDESGDKITVYNSSPEITTAQFKVSYNGPHQSAFFSVTLDNNITSTSFEVRDNSLAVFCNSQTNGKETTVNDLVSAWGDQTNHGYFTLKPKISEDKKSVTAQEKTGFTSESFFLKSHNDLVISCRGGALSAPKVKVTTNADHTSVTVEEQLLSIDCKKGATSSDVVEVAAKARTGNFTVTTTNGATTLTPLEKPEPILPAVLFTNAANGLQISYLGMKKDQPEVTFDTSGKSITFSISDAALTIACTSNSTPEDILSAWSNPERWKDDPKKAYQCAFFMQLAAATSSVVATKKEKLQPLYPITNAPVSLSAIDNSEKYHQVMTTINAQAKIYNFPPSGAMAGIYNKVDEERGVWQSPANISLNSVLAPSQAISAAAQEDLNVDPATGKSINAIRAFIGKGNLVWGARTLNGNSNDWRYISVRRLISYIELSIQTSVQNYVFEQNNAMTWLKVRAMIENFLDNLWQEGALAGSKADDAFFVNVGLGSTMTAQDILEGRMIVSIGVAAVHPAEFIILEVTQLMQK